MFFILGITSRTSTVDTGVFRCPNEGADRRYRHERARRWFTLVFIPLVPLGTQGERVQCDSCGVRYGTDALTRHPAGGVAQPR
jgi:hypothetical protein